ncbi:hypothetical protein H3C70_03700 [Patescibacteria group bacterium]|nr:hypothetical protein [Patescibacteria group bacterium]
MIEIVLFLTAFLFVGATPVHAYLDPGTGSYITQIAIGFLVGGGYVAKVYWHQIKSRLQSLFGKKKKDGSEQKTD